MRISLTELEKIEKWLFRKGDVSDRLVTEAQLLSSPELQDKMRWQLRSYSLIRRYGREKLRREIKEVENELFHSQRHSSFKRKIEAIFKK